MEMKKSYIFLVVFFLISSCIEIIDDIKFNIDGSGTFKYTINLSSSQVKLNSILALDSLDGKRVPSLLEIHEKIEEFTSVLSIQEGISNVSVDTNYSHFIFKIECDFTNILALQQGIQKSLKSTVNQLEEEELSYNWISWNGQILVRKIPDIEKMNIPSLKTDDSDLLKNGNYTSITRFENRVNKFDNLTAILSKNEKAVMIRKSVFDVLNDRHIMDNIIYVDSTRY